MSFTSIRRAAIALALLTAAGCTVKSTDAPPLSGPSGLALTLNVNASPDSINQDGGSQSSVKITGDRTGRQGRIASLPLRLDMFVSGVPQDYGTLSARSVVTDSDGVATVRVHCAAEPRQRRLRHLLRTAGQLRRDCRDRDRARISAPRIPSR